MTLEQAEQLKYGTLKYGVMSLGVILIGATVVALIKGETWGATGKGRIYKSDEPFYFAYMIIVRTILGIGCIVGALYL